MLRASGETDGEDYDIESVRTGAGDGGVAHGELLLAFCDALFGDNDDVLDRVRADALATLGQAGFVDAAGTAASFNSVVRVADATGIPIDEFKQDAAREVLGDLGLDDFPTSSVT